MAVHCFSLFQPCAEVPQYSTSQNQLRCTRRNSPGLRAKASSAELSWATPKGSAHRGRQGFFPP
eukprot:5580640-Alexandrium_andersonii.AAC.1